ncbi:MAG TPA: glycosyltransferase family 4 protein, partial [Candidatus Cloacimonadota bacterium]|nr:glycosyltransferase family 4 protein [Candidatus Cloacimonadota bacterium]
MTYKALKVALLGPAPPFRGGISVFATHLATELREMGHEPRFFNFISQYPKLLFPGGDQYNESQTDIPNERVLTPYMPNTWLSTINAINQYQPDIILVSWWLPYFAPAYGTILRGLRKYRIIYIAHNIIPHENWPGTRALLRYALSPAEKIVVLSQACLDDLKQSLPNYIARKGILGFHPVYNYSQSSAPAEVVPQQDRKNILFFGLIKPYKGLAFLIKAMPLILEKHPSARLILAGAVYGSSSDYDELISKLGIDSRVERLYRYISDAEIATLFHRCDLCVLPYTSATQSGVIATAYSFDMPVIASATGGLSEYVIPGQTGFLVPPGDSVALAGAITDFFDNNSGPQMREYI